MRQSDLAAALRALLERTAAELAALITKHGTRGQSEPALERWPGSSRQLRRVQAQLRERGFELEAFAVGRAHYCRRADLAQVPSILAKRRDEPALAETANDGDAGDVQAAADRLLVSILERSELRLGKQKSAPAQTRTPEPQRRRAAASRR